MNDPFARLGLPRAFAIDRKAAEKNHRELSRALHPDRYLDAAPQERRRALEEAADVNEAFRVVKDPIRRAEALFRLRGIDVGETNEPKPSSMFLMEMMELREEIDAAREACDATLVGKLRARVKNAVSLAEAQLAALFPEVGESELEGLRGELARLGELRFYARAMETLDDLEERLADTSGGKKE